MTLGEVEPTGGLEPPTYALRVLQHTSSTPSLCILLTTFTHETRRLSCA